LGKSSLASGDGEGDGLTSGEGDSVAALGLGETSGLAADFSEAFLSGVVALTLDLFSSEKTGLFGVAESPGFFQ
jgi:hypothetical protein